MISPLNMLQEQQLGKPHAPWRILVCCILLNRTHGRQVRPMIDKFFGIWPSPQILAQCESKMPEELGSTYDMERLLKPLGFWNQRRRSLIAMSEAYDGQYMRYDEEGWRDAPDGEWARGLPGCGQYAVDSLNVFLYGKLENVSSDTWINDWIRWRQDLSKEPPRCPQCGVNTNFQGCFCKEN